MKWSSSKLRCPLNIKYVPDFKDLVRIKECKISYQSLFILITYWDDNVFNILEQLTCRNKNNFTCCFLHYFKMQLLEHLKLYVWLHSWLTLYFYWTGLVCPVLLREDPLKRKDSK